MRILTNLTNRAFPNLKIGLQLIRKATFQELHTSDLKELIKNKLSKIYYQDNTYVFFFYAKNAFNSKYELFLNCFPKKHHITHTIDELNSKYQKILFEALEKSQISIKKYADINNKKLVRLYSYQHIGVNELNPYEFKTTYLQTHWHIYGIDSTIIDNCTMLKHEKKCFVNTFNEYFIELYADILGKGVSSIDYHTHSIILSKKKLSLKIDSIDQKIINNTIVKWKNIWTEIAKCFTDFTISSQGRYKLYTDEEILNNLNRLFVNNSLNFSLDSKKRMSWLAKNIKKIAQLNDPTAKEYWRTIHMGINGSIGITHNFENDTSTIKIAPRTFATLERIGCLDRYYFCLKNRKEYLNQEQITQIKNIQCELFSIFDSNL